jgi:hypothetical protein
VDNDHQRGGHAERGDDAHLHAATAAGGNIFTPPPALGQTCAKRSVVPTSTGYTIDTGLNDFKLLDEAKTALRDKDIKPAEPLFADFSERRAERVKAKVANDPA